MKLPKCGLYKTGKPLEKPDHTTEAGLLVFFHNHSEQGPPLVLLPRSNEHNRWDFHERGYLVDGPSATEFVEGLIPLAQQGLYIVKHHIHVTREEILGERTLLQLGYDRAGRVLLFPALAEGNGFRFPDRGYRFDDPAICDRLEPAGFDPPRAPPERMLH